MMNDPITIRRAVPADLAIIARHRLRMFEDMGHADLAMLKASVPFYTAWLKERLENGRYLGWFACAGDGEVIAGAGLWLLDWPPGILDVAPFRGYLFNVYTEPAFRKRGLARRLIQAIKDHCAAEGIRVISLHSSTEGRSTYDATGFVPTNEMRYIQPEE
jgi:ribosomal protein S18 acetylase RimI-like enzyme